MAATADVISDGRLLLGLGSGSVRVEHEQAGLAWGSFAERSERLEESLAIVTGMLADDRTTFAGRHHAVHDLPNIPGPVQRPRPPILVGGAGPRTIELAARYADIWNCPTYALGELDAKIAALHAACDRVGRDPASIRLSTQAVLALAPTDGDVEDVRSVARRRYGGPGFGLDDGGLVGTSGMIVERLRRSVERGISLFVFFLHDRGERATLELLAGDVLPALR
jgi:alkanesulfonate monooxygenase SsuD/methylene tetrahydromethanopterin reductase-like flavin-dependent oxidoreductase (luciferase family)